MTSEKIRWGILGTGTVAKIFAKAILGSRTGRLCAVASRDRAKAEAFSREFGAPAHYGNYEALLADPAIQVIYIALPHIHHAKWTILAANAGKHVLCEKPLAMNHLEAKEMVEAAARNDVFLMEAFMYRCHPQTAKLIEMLQAKIIGEIAVINATFSFQAERGQAGRYETKEVGGGGILDVGCYPISMTRLLAGAALGKDFADPLDIRGVGHIGEVSGVDEWAVCCLKFPQGILSQVATGVFVSQENVLRIYGSDGDIFVPSPWVPGGREPGVTSIFVRKRGEKSAEEIKTETKYGVYSLEADMVGTNIGRRQAPVMTWEDSLGNMRTLDRWRMAIGAVYPADQAAGCA